MMGVTAADAAACKYLETPCLAVARELVQAAANSVDAARVAATRLFLAYRRPPPGPLATALAFLLKNNAATYVPCDMSHVSQYWRARAGVRAHAHADNALSLLADAVLAACTPNAADNNDFAYSTVILWVLRQAACDKGQGHHRLVLTCALKAVAQVSKPEAPTALACVLALVHRSDTALDPDLASVAGHALAALVKQTTTPFRLLPTAAATNTLFQVVSEVQTPWSPLRTISSETDRFQATLQLFTLAVHNSAVLPGWRGDANQPLQPWVALHGLAACDIVPRAPLLNLVLAPVVAGMRAAHAACVLCASKALVHRFPGVDHTPLLWPLWTRAVQDAADGAGRDTDVTAFLLRKLLGASRPTRLSVLSYLRIRLDDTASNNEVAAWMKLMNFGDGAPDLQPAGESAAEPWGECSLTAERALLPLAHFGDDAGEDTAVAPWCLLRALAEVGHEGLRSPFTRRPLSAADVSAAHPALAAAAAAAVGGGQ